MRRPIYVHTRAKPKIAPVLTASITPVSNYHDSLPLKIKRRGAVTEWESLGPDSPRVLARSVE